MLFAISVLTFLIFQAIPNGDPALRLAGRLATPQQVADVRHQWGFDQPIYVQYAKTMDKIFTGKVVSYTAAGQRAAGDQARPAGDAVAGDRRGGHLALRWGSSSAC